MHTSSNTLWRSWTERRDESAFEALVRPELPALFDTARRVGLSRSAAEDVVQDALTALAGERSRKPGDVGVGAWLMRTVRFRALTAKRSTRRRTRHEARVPEREHTSGVSLDVRDEIESALDGLRDKDRQILLLRFVYDLDYREIAYVLGASENACRIRLHRASGRLRDRLGPKAPALLAALSVTDVPRAAQMIAVASKSAAAPVSLGVLGGLLVGTTSKMLTAGVVGAALTAGLFAGLDPMRPAVGPEDVQEPESATRDESSAPMLHGIAPPDLADLAPDAAEVAFLREALAQERERVAQAVLRPGDSGLDILTRVFTHRMDPWPLMRDAKDFHSRVNASPEVPMRVEADGEDVKSVVWGNLGSQVIEFGPGTFKLDMRGSRVRDRVPHIQIRGAGKDETRLLVGGEFLVTGDLEHLLVRDLTMDFRNGSEALDVRERAAASFENVRFLDWAGGGHSAVIGVSGNAYLSCVNCEFVDTDGTGGRTAVSFRGPSLGVLRDCTFHGVRSAVSAFAEGRGSRALFVDCEFEDSSLAGSNILDREKRPIVEIVVENCNATFGDPSWTIEQRRMRWGAAYAKVAHLSLSATSRLVTVSQLTKIIREVQFPDGEQLFSIHLSGWAEGQPSAFRASTHVAKLPRPKVYTVLRVAGVWTARHDPRGGGPGFWVWSDLASPMALVEALEAADLMPDTVANRVGLMRQGNPNDSADTRYNYYNVTGGDKFSGVPGTLINASTGEVVSHSGK